MTAGTVVDAREAPVARLALPALLLALLALAAYAPAFWSGFVWDDNIVFETQLPALTAWWHPLWPPAGIAQWSVLYYRPVPIGSLLFESRLFGDAAAGYHVMNVLYHVATTLALWALLRRLLGARPGAAAGALAGACLFAVHPIHTESVSWINGRTDLLAAMFLVPAVLLALGWRDTGRWPALAGSGLAFLLAILSKETAFAGLVLLPAAMALAPRPPSAGPATTAARGYGGVAVMLAIALAVAIALRLGVDTGGGTTSGPSRAADLALLPRSLAWLALKAAWPWPQSSFVADDALPPASAGVATALLLAALAAWALRRWLVQRDGLPLFALAWFATTAAPALAAALAGVAETAMAERFLYLPSVAVSMAAAAAIAAAVARGLKPIAFAATAVLVVAWGATSVQRGLVWRDNLSLWADAAAKAPAEGMPLNELAVAHAVAGEVERAFAMWTQARELRNTAENAGIIEANLGNYWLRKRDYARAREHLEAAIGKHAALPNAQQALGRVLAVQATAIPLTADSAGTARELLERARRHYDLAVRMLPAAAAPRIEFAELLLRLGELQARMGEPAAAAATFEAGRAELDRAVALDPAAAAKPGVQRLRAALDAAGRGSP